MTDYNLQLAVFRLDDMCVGVQEGMDRFLTTASLEKMPGVEATFSWLRKRGVRVCLLSDHGRKDTSLLLDRLNWSVDENGTVQEVITRQLRYDNPVFTALEHAGLQDANLSFTAFDTPRLLTLSNRARVHFNLAVCNGKSSYSVLATAPHHAMLDSLVQLPNFVLQHLPDPQFRAGTQVQKNLLRLRLPRPFEQG